MDYMPKETIILKTMLSCKNCRIDQEIINKCGLEEMQRLSPVILFFSNLF